jgi:hypothetical protein
MGIGAAGRLVKDHAEENQQGRIERHWNEGIGKTGRQDGRSAQYRGQCGCAPWRMQAPGQRHDGNGQRDADPDGQHRIMDQLRCDKSVRVRGASGKVATPKR